jgi:uncharacterized protein YpmB
MPTTSPVVPPQPISTNPNPITNPDKVTDSMLDQSGTENNHGSDPFLNTGLIVGIVVAVLIVIIIIILIAAIGFIIIYKKQKKEVPTASSNAYGTGLHDQAKISIDTNEAYATNAEAKRCVAYGTSAETNPCVAYVTSAETKPCVTYTTNITTERNVAYGIKLQDVAMSREGNAYDYIPHYR